MPDLMAAGDPAAPIAKLCHKMTTTDPVVPGDFTGSKKEFGRWQDAQNSFSIKRGTLYNLLNDGKIRGCLLRVMGAKSGLRLFDMRSIRDFISAQMQAEAAKKEAVNGTNK